MARDINDIQRDIERSRAQLAGILDNLAERTKPANLANDAKAQAAEKFRDPKVQKTAAAVGAVVVGLVVIAVARSRKRKKDIKELQKILAGRN